MADKNYTVARNLIEQAKLLAGSAGFKLLQRELGYVPVEQFRSHAKPAVSNRSAPLTVEFERDGALYVALWDRKLLDGGESRLQGLWDTSIIGSTRDYFDSMAAADQALKRRFRRDFKDYFMMTSTRTTWHPDGLADVVHNWRSPNEARIEGTFTVGPDGLLDQLDDAEAITQSYFGTKDVDNVVRVIRKVSGQKPYFGRFNSAPNQIVSRPVGLGLGGSDRFGISADLINRPARGVVVAQRERSSRARE
jgi:hypothetical protein